MNQWESQSLASNLKSSQLGNSPNLRIHQGLLKWGSSERHLSVCEDIWDCYNCGQAEEVILESSE